MQDLLLSTTVLASFIGGVLALLAPCCVSVMLPAYFASSFRQRSRLVLMTVVFAAGVGTVILPIALGASFLSRLLNEQHAIIFSIGGGLMVLAGLAMLNGWKFMLPMPSMRTGGGSGLRSVYSLGAFSGAASACCAPVLAGVAAVSGAVASFPAALAVGIAYVFGMVAPLTVIALLWDRRDWGKTRLLASRTVTLRAGRLRRTVLLSTLLSAVLMILMGALTMVLALAGQGMATGEWQIRLTAALGHAAAQVEDALSFIPGWLSAALVFGALAVLVLRAVRSRGSETDPSPTNPTDGEDRAVEPTETSPTGRS
ncbi:cytochrome c biogenesis CcdA family protein [Blastococcus saxobsidens]|uniref:Cytochrome c biogenesis protein transmembrane region n=1 Tax=Blastococcus saxobsidens (strain DD2) TaxID=1146883 RepID=H6RQ20_BLASD|nr:cytochrome c biogenesis protein CcdA [Blastococcus saxobsidens]CCG02789.1 Cytochrome c biogenesis protein transmembrane region [Blastococcus saxobsidens DD2]